MLELRVHQRRNLLATLMLSEGLPLLLGGDEFGRSKNDDNNRYCQDNELTWFDWSEVAKHSDRVDFTARLCREPLDFTVHDSLRDLGWQVEIDTADPAASGRAVDPSAGIT